MCRQFGTVLVVLYTATPTKGWENHMSIIGERVRRERIRRQLPQAEAGVLFGISQPSFHRWESGATKPDAEHFAKLGDFLGCTVDEVWAMVFEEAPPVELDRLAATVAVLAADVARLSRQVRSLLNIQ